MTKHVVAEKDLWHLVQDNPWIAPEELFAAITQQAQDPPLDFRTRLLIRDETTANLQTEAKLKKQAEQNWYILFGEALPQ